MGRGLINPQADAITMPLTRIRTRAEDDTGIDEPDATVFVVEPFAVMTTTDTAMIIPPHADALLPAGKPCRGDRAGQ